jgi:hypothetical protein
MYQVTDITSLYREHPVLRARRIEMPEIPWWWQTRNFLVALTGLAVLCAQAQADSSIPSLLSVVRAAVLKKFPGATLLEFNDINGKECDPVPQYPAVAVADINGDGRVDFGVLLKAGDTGETVDWQGAKLKRTRFIFSIFLADGHEGYKSIFVRRFTDFSPLAAYVDVQPRGNVTNVGSRKAGTTLRNPGVAFINCGKSVAVHYLVRGRVRTIWVSD